MILIKVKELSELLGLHRNTVRNWLKSGRIRAMPAPGRGLLFSEKDLEALIAEFNVDPTALSKAKKVAIKPPPEKGEVDALYGSQTERRMDYMPSKTVGSVMVVGGGIAGIQASLDLADSGFKVYLVEKTSGIGGRMSQLDKTYPTNDCSM
jgi:excisionase family DNA binding protein